MQTFNLKNWSSNVGVTVAISVLRICIDTQIIDICPKIEWNVLVRAGFPNSPTLSVSSVSKRLA